MSKARQGARAERGRATAQRTAAREAERARVAAIRARDERRRLVWRRLRLWQHGPAFRKRRETWGALASLVLLILLVVYLFSRSLVDLLVTALALILFAPVLVLLFFDRSGK